MSTRESLSVRAFRFLGQVQFTMLLLGVGVVVMTLGTLIESRISRTVAQAFIYRTVWFDVFLFLIAVNLIVSVINRIPIHRHQWSFVLTHVSIVLLLAGAWISRTFGYEGRMVIFEGSEQSEIYLDSSELRVEPVGTGEAAIVSFPLPETHRPAGTVLRREALEEPGIRILDYVAEGTAEPVLGESDESGTPGIAYMVSGQGEHVRRIALARGPNGHPDDLGPFEVAFRVDPEEAFLSEIPPDPTLGSAASVRVLLAGDTEACRIPLPEALGQEQPCGRGLRVEVTQFLAHAQMVGDALRDVPEAPANPAAVVQVRSGGKNEQHMVFSRFPDFTAVHGREAGKPLVSKIELETRTRVSKPRIGIWLGSGNRMFLRLTQARGPAPALPLALGQTIPLGDLGFDFTLERFVPRARREIEVSPLVEDGTPYIRLEASLAGRTDSFWLRRGTSSRRTMGGQTLEWSFAARRRSVPFTLALRDFELIRYPGSRRPAGYRSHVTVKSVVTGDPDHDAIISMNKPLDVAGFRLFQSSYQLGEQGRPDATILSVSHDPGVPLVYFSFCLLILGIGWFVKVRGPRLVAEEPVLHLRHGTSIPSDVAAQEERGESNVEKNGVRPSAALLIGAAVGLIVVAASMALATEPGSAPLPFEKTRAWAVQADGRVKPIETFAKQTVIGLTGRKSLFGMNTLEIFWGYVFDGGDFRNRELLRIDSRDLKLAMGIDPEKRRLSFFGIMGNPKFQTLVEKALRVNAADQPMSRLEHDALEAYEKLERVSALMRHTALALVPITQEHGPWLSIADLEKSSDPAQQTLAAAFRKLGDAYRSHDPQAFGTVADQLTSLLREVSPAVYPAAGVLAREVFYEQMNAFGKAWKFYLAGFLLVGLLGFNRSPWAYVIGMACLVIGLVCHTLGIGLRWVIAGRAPVSDMYESLVFMGWGAIALGLVPEFMYRKRYFALVAGMIGFLCLAFAENLPIDSAINPLVPVLAHTAWLSIHVMTVMLSYSALALTMALGHAALFLQIFRPGKTTQLHSISTLLYKMLQVGLLFLAAGIVCGAVWANESWGRYWGWDPKETWSLITFFIYLAIVHAHFAGWLRDFGLAVSAIVAFLSVIMTYYGVNFVLGAGMHSYGFAEGGQIYVVLYVLAELAIVTAAFARYRMTIRPTVRA